LLFVLVSSLFSDSLDKDKKWGVAINLLYPTLSASYFNHEKGYEIEVPIAYMDETDSHYEKTKSYTLDVHYVKYTSGEIGGWYYSGFGRLTYIEGAKTDTSKVSTILYHPRDGHYKDTKFALGAGFGYKKFNLFGNRSAYWSAGINLGAYVIGDHDMLANGFLYWDDKAFVFNIQVLKFGYTF